MSQRAQYAQFFFQLADLGCALRLEQLRDGARNLLQLVPPDVLTVMRLEWVFGVNASQDSIPPPCNLHTVSTVDNLFFSASPSQVLYNLEVCSLVLFFFCLFCFALFSMKTCRC